MDVRRLAAIDMYGIRGTTRRRRIILAEFILGAIAIIGFGAWLLASSANTLDRVLALYVILIGTNYVPLALHAVALSRPGALDTELASVDTARELRRYSILQLWIFVPLALVVMAARQTRSARS